MSDKKGGIYVRRSREIWRQEGKKWRKARKKRGEKRGEKKIKLLNVINLMETMTLTVDQALDALKINEKKEREAIIKAMRG